MRACCTRWSREAGRYSHSAARIERAVNAAHFTEVLFVGFFTAAGLYSALVFLITRDRPFLWYAALMDAMAAAQLVFYPDLVPQISHGAALLAYRTVAFALLFAAQVAFVRAFLQLQTRSPKYMRALWVLLAVNIAGLALAFITAGAEPYRTIDHVLFLLLLGACGLAAWESASTGLDEARYYVVAFAGALAGAIASGAAEWMGSNVWAEYCFQFGLAWEGALLALAIASRYAKVDPLTGAKSRHAFEERLAVAWQFAAKTRSGLAVVIVAINGLRDYDARHGRIAGDALLRKIGALCLSCCGDRVDLFARYGDEAFAAIVPNVSRAQGDAIGAELRERVARESPLVVGVGVSSIENAISAKALVQQAARRSARDAISREPAAAAE
jgi:diguanylate cyclase (GGDEF)-like protein